MLGIRISADARQVAAARKEVEMLNRELVEASESGDGLNIGGDDLVSRSALLQKIREDVTRLGQLARTGDSRGGVLNTRQFVEAGKLSGLVRSNISDWQKEVDKVTSAMGRLIAEKRKLEKVPLSNPTEWVNAQERLSQIGEEKKGLSSTNEKLNAERARMEGLEERAKRHTGVIGGFSQAQEAGNIGGILKKAAGSAMAIYGGFSLLQFAAESYGKYGQFAGHEATLASRGASTKPSHAAAYLGYSPLEDAALKEQISGATGLTGRRLDSNVTSLQAFARAKGVDVAQLAGFQTSMYQQTSKSTLGEAMLLSISKQKVANERMSELLQIIVRNTGMTATAMKGTGASDKQIAAATALSVMAIKSGDKDFASYAKSGEFANLMQNGLKSAGTDAGEVMLFQQLGGFKGPMDFKKMFEMSELREGGFLSRPDILKNIIGMAPGGGKDSKETAGWLMSIFPDMELSTKSAKMISEAFGKGGILENFEGSKADLEKELKAMSSDKDPAKALAAKEMLDEYAKNPAQDKLKRLADNELIKIEAGEKLDKIFAQIQGPMQEFAKSLLDGNWKEAFAGFGKAVIGMNGVGKAVLAAAVLMAAGGAMSMIGGALGMMNGMGGGLGGVAGALGRVAGALGRVFGALGLGGTAAIGGTLALGGAAMYYGNKNHSMKLEEMTVSELEKEYRGKRAFMPPNSPEMERIAGYITKKGGKVPGLEGGFTAKPWHKYYNEVRTSANRHGLSEALVGAVIDQESQGKALAVGTSGEKGLMQLMPRTGGSYGLARDKDFFDPQKNIEAGTTHLATLLKQYGGDTDAALRAYNGGDKAAKTGFNQKYADEVKSRMGVNEAPADGLADILIKMILPYMKGIGENLSAVATNTTPTLSHAAPAPFD